MGEPLEQLTRTSCRYSGTRRKAGRRLELLVHRRDVLTQDLTLDFHIHPHQVEGSFMIDGVHERLEALPARTIGPELNRRRIAPSSSSS